LQSTSDWLYLLGFLFLLVGTMSALYLYLPWPGLKRRGNVAAPQPKRTIAQWSELADIHEQYAPGHARRVAALAARLADAVALPEIYRAALEQACLLHDVGEIGQDAELLGRRGLLSQDELFRLWRHSQRGAQLAREIGVDEAASQWVRWHHERWDGLGYPDGLAGKNIPLPARILRLADSAEAMLQARPYRPAFSPDQVIAEINRLAGISYDPDLARIFVDYVLPHYLAEQAGARPEGTAT
jgi:HD-GYP domain-containing protein (c-di-GMP phosphodiesterase class II)